MEQVDTILLSSAHSLIMGHKPDKLSLSDVNRLQPMRGIDTDQFGLIDINNPSQYYPDLTEEDFNPKDSDFIYPVFRLLSETIVHHTWNPIDFSKEGVLKKSTPLLVGQSINTNHMTMVENAIGSVLNTEWQDSYKTKNNIKVPSGINGVFKIDAKANPRLARGIMMNPPSIHSNSVSVTFAWEKSHPELDNEEFWSKLGTYDENGNMYRRVVTEIKWFSETSVVNHGADPWSQIVNDKGEIINPKYAKSHSVLKERIKEGKANNSFFSYKQLSNLDTILNKSKDKQTIVKKPKEMEFEILATTFDLALPEGKDKWDMATFQKAMKTRLSTGDTELQDKLNDVTTERDNLKIKVEQLEEGADENLKTQNTELTQERDNLKTIVDQVLADGRKEAKRLYMAVNDLKEEDEICESFDDAEYKVIKAHLKTLNKQFDAKFPSGQSSSSDNGGGGESETLSTDELRHKILEQRKSQQDKS